MRNDVNLQFLFLFYIFVYNFLPKFIIQLPPPAAFWLAVHSAKVKINGLGFLPPTSPAFINTQLCRIACASQTVMFLEKYEEWMNECAYTQVSTCRYVGVDKKHANKKRRGHRYYARISIIPGYVAAREYEEREKGNEKMLIEYALYLK